MENYDLNALYLYSDGWSYRIGKIAKVNEKSLRMDFGVKVPKEEFNSLHKLTQEEIDIFNKETIKKVSNSNGKIKEMITTINSLQKALLFSEFACIDTKKLQENLDKLNSVLEKEIQSFKIGNKEFTFNDYNFRLTEVE